MVKYEQAFNKVIGDRILNLAEWFFGMKERKNDYNSAKKFVRRMRKIGKDYYKKKHGRTR